MLTNENLLDQICLAVTGKCDEDARRQLSDDLIEFNGGTYLVDEAIENWFRLGKSKPGAWRSHQFLLFYVESRQIKVNIIDDSQRKAYQEIVDWLSHELERKGKTKLTPLKPVHEFDFGSAGKVGWLPNGPLFMNISIAEKEIRQVASVLCGTYFTYRMKYAEEDSQQEIARELLHVYKKNGDMYFQHWYKFHQSSVTKYDGVVLVLNNTVWLIGAAEDIDGEHFDGENQRLRVIEFQRSRTTFELSPKYWWGLLLGSVSQTDDHSPAASRIFLDRIDELKTEKEVEELARKMEYFPSSPDYGLGEALNAEKHRLIKRFVENHATALSSGSDFNPPLEQTLLPKMDKQLKINVSTLRRGTTLLNEIEKKARNSHA